VTPNAVLDDARSAGVDLFATPGGTIRWCCAGPLPEHIRQNLIAHKAEILALLRQTTAWDQVEGERLLAELRSEVDKIRFRFGGRPPVPLTQLLADAITIGERYVREHELEAARGWDALELLRDLVPHVRDLAARWKAAHGRTDSIQAGITGE
jgi:hypothetical protein